MKKTVHIISHTHWDREWYMPFEYHRARLVKLIDDCLALFEADADFRHFHLDGHTALVEDYLEIKPYNREKIKQYVQEGRFALGPWYVLQDEFLTSSEANIRNLLVGMELAESFGGVCPVGYFPDAFGNAGQMPQILKQAGMKAIAFGRGVKPTGVNNAVYEGEAYTSKFSEMYWQSPDGSRLPGILFANWYNNGMEIPADADRAYWDSKLADVERYACTEQLLLMNGCDHQPVQKDLSAAIRHAKELYPDYAFVHSGFERYADAVIAELPETVNTIKGELTSQNTDGWGTLVNTCSAHVDLKVMNRKSELLLENIAEPLAVIAAELGMAYPQDMLLYAWKTLMKNHAHDSICGCSCDAVNDEMRTRFIKSQQAAETVIRDSLDCIAAHIPANGFADCEAVFSVVNTYSREKSGVVSVDADLRRIYRSEGTIQQLKEQCRQEAYTGAYELIGQDGSVVPCTVKRQGPVFGYDLPDDRFRQPYVADRVTVTFEAEAVPAFGYKTYGIKKAAVAAKTGSLITDTNTMENDTLRVRINSDGTLCVLDKAAGRTFDNLLTYEDVGDVGCEYTFVPVQDDKPILSCGLPAQISVVCDEAYRAEYRITTVMQIPKSADERLQQERGDHVGMQDRAAGRSEETVDLTIETYVSLERGGRGVKVRTAFRNPARDHRLRVVMPTGMAATVHKAESVFEAAERNNVHNACWTYPSGCEHQQGFVMMQDEQSGIAVANIGLYEYEILSDNAIAVTLVRAVGELGDWGIFPTQLSQQCRPLSLEYEIVPFTDENAAFAELASFQYPLQAVQNFTGGDGLYQNGGIVWSGDGLRMTALKRAQRGEDVIMRWVNYSGTEQELTVRQTGWVQELCASSVIEAEGEALTPDDGKWSNPVKPYEIVTLRCRRRKVR